MIARILRSLLLCLMFIPLMGVGQEQAYPSVEDSHITTQLHTYLSDDRSTPFNNRIWCYLRFAEVPSAQQRANLALADVHLYQYQPDLRWFASMPTDVEPSMLELAGVDELIWKPLLQKADQRILSGHVPAYAQTGNSVEAAIIVAATGEYGAMVSALEAKGIVIDSRFEPLGIFYVEGTQNALVDAAAMPFVVFVELPEPPAELEIEDEMTTTRGAFINGYYNLNGLTGDGVTIAVNEGGIIDSIYDPDFKNRLDRSLENGNVSGHKTGVSWRMSSAGNINPIHRGQAWGATHMSGGINFTNAAAANVTIVNNSFGYGCIPTGPSYNAGAATNDFLVRTNSRFMITYSCGNIGGSTCSNYGAGPGWGNITGLVKSAKNIFAVGSMNTDDQLTGFSSRGPAMDGRILPDITAAGPGGTSHASPNLAGVNALLTEAYRNENNTAWPNTGLIKAIILNTADDIENPGPDYKTGFGRINASRALEVIEKDQFLTNSVANNAVKNNTINVPSGVSQLKISVYWNDREATPGITGKTLVNDLDMRLQLPNLSWVQPWVLNPFPHPDSLNKVAIQGTDSLNNVEMVTIDNPASGNYKVEVTGTLVPFGPQLYNVIYSYVYDSLAVIYPHGGEGLVPGETRRIRWDAYDSGNTFDLEFSSDSGATWQTITTGLASNLRSYAWTIPNNVSGNCLVKVKAGSQEDISDSRFTIVDPPTNLNLVWRCVDSAMFSWDSVPGALGYQVTRLGTKYMAQTNFTTDPYSKVFNLSATETEWVSVQTVLPDSGESRRAIALSIPPGDFNCIGADLSIVELLSPGSGYFPSCHISDSLDLEFRLKNTGTNTLPYLPFAYQINTGTVTHDTLNTSLNSAAQNAFLVPASVQLQIGPNTFKIWSTYPGDANATNDTLQVVIQGYSGTAASLPYTQNFDNFTNCSTAWGCETVTCGLVQGWYNLPNQNGADSIDWRTHNGNTGSGGTGPSGDHTSGSGKYLYLEGSGNGGGGCQNKEAQLHSPCFDLAGTNQPNISYWYHALGNAIGSLHMDVLAEGTWHLDVAQPINGSQGNQWLQQQADLSAFSGKEIVVRFRGRTGGGWSSDLALDDINLSTLPLADFETTYDTFCLGQTVPLQNLTTYGSSYSWSVPQGSSNYNSGNSSSTNPVLMPTDTGWFDVQLIATNGTGIDTLLIEDFFYVSDFDSPTLVSDAPNDTYCHGAPATFTANGGGSTYRFYYNANLVQNSANPVWSASSLNDGDVLWVVNDVNPTCDLVGPTLVMTVQPDLNGTPLWSDDDDQIICEGDTVYFETDPDLDAYDYTINGTVLQSGPEYDFETNQLVDGDQVFVQLTDSVGCTGATDTLTWTVLPLPATPTILSFGNDSLQASVLANSYRWWNNAQLLADTTQTILAQSSGTYQVQTVEVGCASMPSEGFVHIMVGLEELSGGTVHVFPNPARDQVHLLIEEQGYNRMNLFDQTGRMVLSGQVVQGMNSLQVSELAAGIYVMKLLGTAGSLEWKLVVE